MRVGDVGGNTLGLYGGLFSPCGQSILGHGYHGAFSQWTFDEVSSSLLLFQVLSILLDKKKVTYMPFISYL